MRKLLLLLPCLLFAAAAFAHDTQSELPVSLEFVPQDPLELERPELPAAMADHSVELRVADARAGDPMLLGTGTNDDDRRFPIRADDDVIGYVNDTLHDVAEKWGLTLDRHADRVLKLRLTRFSVDEDNKPVGSVYTAEARLGFVLTDAGGRVLAEGAASGVAHRYGRARSEDNCNEVLSDALQEAFANVLTDARVRSAWGAGEREREIRSERTEQRLRRLEDLYRKKLITRDEYEQKRAEILRGL